MDYLDYVTGEVPESSFSSCPAQEHAPPSVRAWWCLPIVPRGSRYRHPLSGAYALHLQQLENRQPPPRPRHRALLVLVLPGPPFAVLWSSNDSRHSGALVRREWSEWSRVELVLDHPPPHMFDSCVNCEYKTVTREWNYIMKNVSCAVRDGEPPSCELHSTQVQHTRRIWRTLGLQPRRVRRVPLKLCGMHFMTLPRHATSSPTLPRHFVKTVDHCQQMHEYLRQKSHFFFSALRSAFSWAASCARRLRRSSSSSSNSRNPPASPVRLLSRPAVE